MTVARLQRYALFLAGHDYDIEYKNTSKHSNADALSRLPSQKVQSVEDPVEIFHLSQFELLPVTCETVKRETSRDKILSQVRF